MSHNLIEMLRAREGDGHPTALAVLKEAMERDGEITDDARRHAAELSGLPEAAVYGISTFYDDLVEPRGRRHVAVCTGTACWASHPGDHAAELGERLGVEPRRAVRGRLGLLRRHGVPGLLPQLARLPRRHRGRRGAGRAGAGGRRRGRAGAPSPRGARCWTSPCCSGTGSFAGLRRALSELSPEELLEEVKDANLRGRGGAGLPRRARSGRSPSDAEGDEKLIVVNGDEGDPGSYIDKHLMEQCPRLLLEGMALAGYAVGSEHGLVLVRSEYPRLHADPARGDRAGVRRGRARRRHPRQRLLLPRAGRGGRRLLRGRRGDGAAGIAAGPARHGERAAAVPGPARLARQADGGQQRGDAVQRALHRRQRRRGLQGAVTGRDAGREAGVPERAVRQPRRLRGAVRHAGLAHLQRAGRRAQGRQADQGGADRRAAGRRAARTGCWTRRWTSTTWPSTAAWSATARSWPSTRTPTSASCAPTCWSSAPTRAAASAFPAGSACSARSRCPRRPGDIDREKLEALLETLELGSLCAHGGGLPAPIRTLIEFFPGELGLTGGDGPDKPEQERESEGDRRPEEEAVTDDPEEPA